uniref:Uncharacterized protein n=1 Tax=Oryza nivara TaxID=4536 RepID=A0A0E0ISF9_ORYNI
MLDIPASFPTFTPIRSLKCSLTDGFEQTLFTRIVLPTPLSPTTYITARRPAELRSIASSSCCWSSRPIIGGLDVPLHFQQDDNLQVTVTLGVGCGGGGARWDDYD